MVKIHELVQVACTEKCAEEYRAIEGARSEARVNTDKLQNTAKNLHTALESVRQQQIPQVKVDIAGFIKMTDFLAHISLNRTTLEGVCAPWKKESARMGNDHLALSQKNFLMETKFLALQNVLLTTTGYHWEVGPKFP